MVELKDTGAWSGTEATMCPLRKTVGKNGGPKLESCHPFRMLALPTAPHVALSQRVNAQAIRACTSKDSEKHGNV